MIAFAHRGAPLTRRDENTLPAFERALALGAGGLETDIALTADGVPVLVHQGLSLHPGPAISRLRRGELPAQIPSLADLYERCGHDFELSLDLAQPAAIEAVIGVAEEYGAADRLWPNYWSVPTLAAWRRRWPHLHLVYATLPFRLDGSLADVGIDVVNVFHRFCSAALVERLHGRGLRVFSWGMRTRRSLERVVAHGVDGVYCDDVSAMVEIIGRRE